MIDLSYLTEEEQEMIMTVLKRDAELKRAEQQRVMQLQRLLPERGKLKNLTGEWFYEAKSQRHMDRIHGSDIIRASMRPRKPMTLLDLTQSWAKRTSMVSKGNRDTSLIPEPSGPIQEPPTLQKDERENDNTSPGLQQERLRQAIRSLGKQRHNPFNRASSVLLETPGETDDWLTNGAGEPHQTSTGEPLSPPKSNIGGLADDLSSEGSGPLQGTHTELAPIPKKRTIIFGPQLDSNSPVPRWSGRRGSRVRVAAPRGILKHSISWNSNDSGLPYDGQRQGLPSTDTPKLPAAAPETESTFGGQAGMEDEILDDSLDRKQVRFSPPVSLSDATGGPELWEGREFGDQDLLDLDRLEPSDEAKGAGLRDVGSQRNEGDDVRTFSLSRAVCERPTEGEGSCVASSRNVWDGPPALLSSTEPELSWMAYAEHPPCESTPPPFSETQHCRRKGNRGEAGTGQQDNHAESKPSQVPYLLPSVDKKGKLGYVGIGDHDASPVLAVHSPELTEEEGDSIAKVLEWFSRSSDSSDQQEEHVCEQEMDVETKDKQEAPADDGTINTKMREDKDQPVMHKDDVTTINQMTEHSLSEGLPAGEVQSASLRRVQLERSTRVEEKDVVYGEGADKDQTPTAQEMACSESMKDEFSVPQHPAQTSLKTETAYQPKRRLSTAEIKPQGEKKGKAKDEAEEHNGKAKAITFYPVTKAMQQENKPRESRNESTPQRVTDLKSFWESPEILSMATEHCETKKEHNPKFEANKIKEDSNVDFCTSGQEVPSRPKGTCSSAEDENETNGKYVFQVRKGSCHLSRDVHKKEESLGLEDGVSEVNMWSGPLLTQQDSLEIALRHSEEAEVVLAPMCMEKALPPLNSSDWQSLKEEDIKYIAKCVIVDEDVKLLVSPVEMKADFTDILQKEQLPPMTPPLSRGVIAVQQPSSALPVKQSPNELDRSPGKIRHLTSFWESEKQEPDIITGEPKEELVDTKENKIPAPCSRMSKRFSTSAFDLRMTGTDVNDNGDADSPLKQGPNFTILSLKERWMKSSVDQSPSNSQFKNLRDFWGGAPSNKQNPQQSSTKTMPLSAKSLQSKGQESNEISPQKFLAADKNMYLNPNYYPSLQTKDLEKSHFRAQRAENDDLKMYITDISSSKKEPREKKHPCPAPLPRQESVSSDEVKVLGSSSIRHVAESKSAQSQLQIMMQEQQKPAQQPHLQKNSEQAQPIEGRAFTVQRDREIRPEGPRKTSLGNTTEKVNPLRHATSMYTVNLAEVLPEQPMKTQEDPMDGKQPPNTETPERQSSGASDDSKQPQPLARSFIPYDYQHYLGISEGAMFQFALATEKEEETGPCFPPESELRVVSGPVRASTPMGLEELQAKMGSEGQLSHRGTDVIDLESYRSSTPETWSYSGTSSACDDEDTHPVKKALKRATLKPVPSYKSVEDITSLPMRAERSKNTTRRELMLSMDDVSMVPSSPPSSISDPAQMKKMSKSVPSFLQKESSGRDSDSTSESSVRTGRQTRMGSSLTNLSSSSGMASVSSISDSVMSIYSGDFGNVEVRGTIQFSINYVQKLKEFHIFVVRCRDLAAADPWKNRSNPYVKCYLLPEQAKLGKRKTSVKKKTLNPTFNEILRYRIRMETLKTQILNLSVWHNDTFGRNSFLGEVELDLSEWDFGSTQVNNFILRRRIQSSLQPSDYRGEMRLALRFMPQMSYSNRLSSTGEVHIWVKDCNHLPIIRGTSIDPFVKCFVLPDTSRKSRQKTRVMKRTESPAFNHTMVYDGFRAEDLPEACVELTVWDHDRLASRFMGGLRLGLGTGKSYGAQVDWMDSNADEANLWERMMDSPNEWVEDVLTLRMLTAAKNVWK